MSIQIDDEEHLQIVLKGLPKELLLLLLSSHFEKVVIDCVGSLLFLIGVTCVRGVGSRWIIFFIAL